MSRSKTVFNATMALAVRALAGGLIVFYWHLPYRDALLEPGTAFAASVVNAGLALLVIGFFGALLLSGIFVFIRALMGANLLSDPAHWREQAAVRRGVRLVLFLALLLFWMPEFLSVGEWIGQIRQGQDLGIDESLGVIWMAATAYFAVSFLLGVLGPPPRHVKLAPASDGDWLDFMEDFLPGGDAYAEGVGGGGDQHVCDESGKMRAGLPLAQ